MRSTANIKTKRLIRVTVPYSVSVSVLSRTNGISTAPQGRSTHQSVLGQDLVHYATFMKSLTLLAFSIYIRLYESVHVVY